MSRSLSTMYLFNCDVLKSYRYLLFVSQFFLYLLVELMLICDKLSGLFVFERHCHFSVSTVFADVFLDTDLFLEGISALAGCSF